MLLAMNVTQSNVPTSHTSNQADWQKPSLQNYDRVLENLIIKNTSLEKRLKELEIDFQILCITLSVACIAAVLIVYVF